MFRVLPDLQPPKTLVLGSILYGRQADGEYRYLGLPTLGDIATLKLVNRMAPVLRFLRT